MSLICLQYVPNVSRICLQAALLYTSSDGERRIRVHNLNLPITQVLCVCVSGLCVGGGSCAQERAQTHSFHTHTQTHTHTQRQTDRQTDRQAHTHTHTHTQRRTRIHKWIYIHIYMYNPGHRVSRPRGTGSVGCGVGEGTYP